MRRSATLGLAVAIILATGASMTAEADAAVVCQRKNRVKLRDGACKGKEVLVQDLGQVGAGVTQLGADVGRLGTDVAAQSSLLGLETARIDDMAGQFRLECSNAPDLVRAASSHSFYYDNIECGGACRSHDGDQQACEAAWALSEDGATSCFYFKDLCLPCADCGEEAGACTNACRAPLGVTCAADPTRTVFAGVAGSEACQRFETQHDCEQAFHVGHTLRPASCFWSGSECRGCGPRNENDGDCENTCRTIGCDDPTRTTLRQCDDIGNDQIACEAAWHLSGNGGDPASCYFDADTSQCRGCGFPNELRGRCDNTCR